MAMHEDARRYAQGQSPALFIFWHGKLLMMSMLRPAGRQMYAMTSRHTDGEMIVRTMQHFGVQTIRGSSSRGGAGAAAEAIAVLQQGANLSITPDGPRGPAGVVQPGAARIAALAGVPVIPVSYSASRGTHMRSWDRFFIPYPFAKIRFMVGAPVMIEKEQAEAASQLLQERLIAVDRECGEAFATT